jgi:hypothetical protein
MEKTLLFRKVHSGLGSGIRLSETQLSEKRKTVIHSKNNGKTFTGL